eukprot:2069892-Amphidinium_carterae.2
MANLCDYIRSLGFERCYVQCDPEPSTQDLLAVSADGISGASKGPNVERLHGTLEALARTLRLAICETYECLSIIGL